MAERNIFYSSIDPGLRKELNLRKSYLGSFNRSAEAEAWLYQKTAYVKLQAVRRADDTPDAVIETDDEITITSEIKNRTQTTGYFQNTYDASDRYVPKPVVTGLSVANEGKLGSLNKTTVSFTVFSRKQLDRLERHFQVPGKNVKVEYGWTRRTTSQKLEDPDRDTFYTNRKTYIGVIYNFSQQLRPDGGFDCTIQLVSPGSLASGINTNKAVTTAIEATDLQQVKTANLISVLEQIRNKFQQNSSTVALDKPAKVTNGKPFHSKGIDAVAMRVDIKVVDSAADLENTDLQKGAAKRGKGTADVYINLGAIVNYIANFNMLGELVMITKFHFEFHPENSKYADTITNDIIAVDPRRVLLPLPQHRDYDGSNGSGTLIFPLYDGAEPCLAHILISLTELERLADQNKDKEAYTVTQFLNDVFAIISSETGGIIEPALVNFDESVNGGLGKQQNRITYIVNQRFVPETTSVIEKYEFQAFGPNSELRDLTLSTKLPDRYATAMYIGASAPAKTIENVAMAFFNPEGDSAANNATTATPATNDALPSTLTITTIYETESLAGQGGTSPGIATGTGFNSINANPKSTIKPEYEKIAGELGLPKSFTGFDEKTLTDIRDKINKYNIENSADKRAAIQAYIKKLGINDFILKMLRAHVQETSALASQPWNRLIVLPIDATFTIDGVNGFRFGNVIDISYLPLRYQRKGIEFIITKVEDTVQGSEWLTTVTLQCRVAQTDSMKSKPDSGSGGTSSSSLPSQTA